MPRIREIFLGYIVCKDGIRMDPSKVEAILNWLTPSSLIEVRSFHDLTFFTKDSLKSLVPLWHLSPNA